MSGCKTETKEQLFAPDQKQKMNSWTSCEQVSILRD